MAATFEYSESNGVGEDVTDGVTRLDFGSTDATGLNPADNPVVAGNASYEKYIRAKFTTIGVGEKISNIKFYKHSGALGVSSIKADANNAYAQPVATISTIATANVPTVAISALTLLSTEAADNTVIDPAEADHTGYTQYIVLQFQPPVDASPGAITEQIFVVTYDEGA